MPAEVQRSAILASRQRFTLRQTCRMTAFIASRMFVLASDRRSSGGSPSRATVEFVEAFEDALRDPGGVEFEPARQIAHRTLGLFGIAL